MMEFHQEYDRISGHIIEVLVLGHDKAKVFNKFWEKEALPFVGLPDPDHEVSNLYRQEVKLLKLGRMPAQILIDKSGVIKFAYYGNSMADISDIQKIEKALTKEN